MISMSAVVNFGYGAPNFGGIGRLEGLLVNVSTSDVTLAVI